MVRKNPIVRQCTAKAKSTSSRCTHSAMLGATVCQVHGGKAPQVIRKASERIAAVRDSALALLAKDITNEDILRRPEAAVLVRAIKEFTELVETLEGRIARRDEVKVEHRNELPDLDAELEGLLASLAHGEEARGDIQPAEASGA